MIPNRVGRQLGTLGLILGLASGRQVMAETVIIEFAATISESPLSDGPLGVGMPLTGRYSYDSPPEVIDSGVNYADYRFADLTLEAGVNQWRSEKVHLSIRHDGYLGLPNSVTYVDSDMYNVTGFSPIDGPSIDSFRPRVIDLYLIDTDASVYADSLGYELPPVGEFEEMLLTVRSLPAWVTVAADVKSVIVIPEPAVWGFVVPTALLFMCVGRRSGGRLARSGTW